jgi:Flp pilus assembly protein TadG
MSGGRRLGRLWRCRTGGTAVEFAFVAPALLLLLLGIMEVGRLFWCDASLNYAVQQAARCAALQAPNSPCPDQASIQANARQAYPQLATATFTVDQKAPCGVQVSGQLTYAFLVWPLSKPRPVLSASACHA